MMNPNDPYFHQVQPGYGQHQPAAVTPTYGGGMMPPQRPITPGPPVATMQPQQQFTSNGPPQMNPQYGQPSPRPPTQLYGMPPQQPTPNQLAQQMGGMNLMDPNLKSPLPSGPFTPMNGNISPAPPPVMLQRLPLNMQASSPMQPPQQPMIPGMGPPPRGGLLPPTIQQQQQMGMSPQQYQNGAGQ